MKIALHETEAGFTQAVIQLARLHRWLVLHQRPAMTANGWRTAISGNAGFPDLVLSRRGRLIFAELKAAKGRLSEAQETWLSALRETQDEVYVWRPADWAEIKRILS